MRLRPNQLKVIALLVAMGCCAGFTDSEFWGIIRPATTTNAAATTASQQRTTLPECQEVCEGRVLVKLSTSLTANLMKQIQTFVEDKIGQSAKVRQIGGLDVVSISAPGITVQNLRDNPLVRDFASSFRIDYIEPDMQLTLHALPGDRFFPNQWGLLNTGQRLGNCSTTGTATASSPQGIKGVDINVSPAWAKRQKSGNIIVAVLDTGISPTHDDLGRNLWNAPEKFDLVIGGPFGEPVKCKAGSHGFNSITNTCNPTDSQGHGSSVAGILGAARDEKVGTVGVDPNTSIIALKAFDQTKACVSQVVNAIDFLVQVKNHPKLNADIRIVNNSYGFKAQTISPCKVHEDCMSKVLKEGVQRTLDNGILFVAAAGNGRRDTDCIPEFPAGYDFPNIISVGALTNLGNLTGFSNFGVKSVDLVAPGLDICVPGVKDYYYADGTSMAAPFVSGAASLMLSRCGKSLSYDQIKKYLIENADLVDLHFDGNEVRGRRLNVGNAVSACAP